MSRGLTTTVKNTLAARNMITVDLLEIEFTTPRYLTSGGYDINTSTPTSGGAQNYLAQGDVLKEFTLTENNEMRVNRISFVLSGNSGEYVTVALTEDYLHKKFRVYKALLTAATLALVDTPVLIYEGSIIGSKIVDSKTASKVTFSTANEFYDFEYKAGRYANDGSQQKYFPGDRGMRYALMNFDAGEWGKG